MSVKFCIVAGAAEIFHVWNGCASRVENRPRLGWVRFGNLQYKIYSPKFLQTRIEVAEEMTDDTPGIWRGRIICTLEQVESVFCISFIPADPYTPQTLLVMRMRDTSETAESYPVYCLNFPACKFMLPQEGVEQVFDLSKLSIAQTIEHFDDSLIPIFKKVLGYLEREEKLKGMALTLTNQDGLKTYVWRKG